MEQVINSPLIAKTMKGLEGVLEKELIDLGFQDVKPGGRSVQFSGGLEEMYKANLWCRTALRILKPLFQFEIQSEEDLYKNMNEYPWEDLMGPDNTLAIDSILTASFLSHSLFVSQKCKDAIADRFRKINGIRPSVQLEDPDLRINVYIYENTVHVSLDSSGGSLHKRGYKESANEAPLNEVLAAGLILLTGWKGETVFADPMCGSGTLLTEAGLIAKNHAPGLFRRKYGFMTWKDFDADLWKRLISEAQDSIRPLQHAISGGDISMRSVKIARQNLMIAGLGRDISIFHMPFEEFRAPGENGLVIINPPYGERLREEDMNALYRDLGSKLKRDFQGFTAWILSANKEALKFIGLHPSAKIDLMNGALDCKYQKYELYSGSKKLKKQHG